MIKQGGSDSNSCTFEEFSDLVIYCILLGVFCVALSLSVVAYLSSKALDFPKEVLSRTHL